MCRSASVKRYLLTHDIKALHECRDSACWRPFGVRLRGNGWFQRSLLHRCAAPLRMTQWVGRFVRYNLFVAMLLSWNHIVPPTQQTLPRVISEQTPAALRRTPKGRQQAESRHSYMASSRNALRLPTGCEAAHCNKLPPPQKQKLSPSAPASYKANQIFALHRRVRLGKVLGE